MNTTHSKYRQIPKAIRCSIVLLAFTAISSFHPVFGQDKDSIATLRGLGKAFSSVAEKAAPAVVGVKSEREVSAGGGSLYGSPFEFFGDDPFQYFFRQPQPRERSPERKYRQSAQGSGFIISADGYVLTNNHVVEDAVKVEVELADERKFTAKVVGTDPESDVAVLKIDAKKLPFVALADSDAIEVGEWVLAIGNPFGLSHTVTGGIVSAKGRTDVGIATYENFIQTDAAINFGNSGGPLINLNGEVVGINTAIVGASGNIGIGFAIPINMAKNIFEQLKDTGEVVRGFLGVMPQDLTPEMGKVFGLQDGKGVVIAQVTPGSAADKGGLKHNDVVLELNGKVVETASDFRNRIARYRPGTEVKMTIWRQDNHKTISVTLGKRPPRDELMAESSGSTVPDLGFSVENLSEGLAERLGFEGQSGVVVKRVETGSQASQAGLKSGMLIKEVNKRKVHNAREFNAEIKKAKDKGQVLLLVRDDQHSFFVFLNLDKD